MIVRISVQSAKNTAITAHTFARSAENAQTALQCVQIAARSARIVQRKMYCGARIATSAATALTSAKITTDVTTVPLFARTAVRTAVIARIYVPSAKVAISASAHTAGAMNATSAVTVLTSVKKRTAVPNVRMFAKNAARRAVTAP